MPDEEKLRPQESENLRADIKRLSEYSEQLRREATKNAQKADALVQRIKELEQRMAESKARKAKKTSGRIR